MPRSRPVGHFPISALIALSASACVGGGFDIGIDCCFETGFARPDTAGFGDTGTALCDPLIASRSPSPAEPLEGWRTAAITTSRPVTLHLVAHAGTTRLDERVLPTGTLYLLTPEARPWTQGTAFEARMGVDDGTVCSTSATWAWPIATAPALADPTAAPDGAWLLSLGALHHPDTSWLSGVIPAKDALALAWDADTSTMRLSTRLRTSGFPEVAGVDLAATVTAEGWTVSAPSVALGALTLRDLDLTVHPRDDGSAWIRSLRTAVDLSDLDQGAREVACATASSTLGRPCAPCMDDTDVDSTCVRLTAYHVPVERLP